MTMSSGGTSIQTSGPTVSHSQSQPGRAAAQASSGLPVLQTSVPNITPRQVNVPMTEAPEQIINEVQRAQYPQYYQMLEQQYQHHQLMAQQKRIMNEKKQLYKRYSEEYKKTVASPYKMYANARNSMPNSMVYTNSMFMPLSPYYGPPYSNPATSSQIARSTVSSNSNRANNVAWPNVDSTAVAPSALMPNVANVPQNVAAHVANVAQNAVAHVANVANVSQNVGGAHVAVQQSVATSTYSTVTTNVANSSNITQQNTAAISSNMNLRGDVNGGSGDGSHNLYGQRRRGGGITVRTCHNRSIEEMQELQQRQMQHVQLLHQQQLQQMQERFMLEEQQRQQQLQMFRAYEMQQRRNRQALLQKQRLEMERHVKRHRRTQEARDGSRSTPSCGTANSSQNSSRLVLHRSTNSLRLVPHTNGCYNSTKTSKPLIPKKSKESDSENDENDETSQDWTESNNHRVTSGEDDAARSEEIEEKSKKMNIFKKLSNSSKVAKSEDEQGNSSKVRSTLNPKKSNINEIVKNCITEGILKTLDHIKTDIGMSSNCTGSNKNKDCNYQHHQCSTSSGGKAERKKSLFNSGCQYNHKKAKENCWNGNVVRERDSNCAAAPAQSRYKSQKQTTVFTPKPQPPPKETPPKRQCEQPIKHFFWSKRKNDCSPAATNHQSTNHQSTNHQSTRQSTTAQRCPTKPKHDCGATTPPPPYRIKRTPWPGPCSDNPCPPPRVRTKSKSPTTVQQPRQNATNRCIPKATPRKTVTPTVCCPRTSPPARQTIAKPKTRQEPPDTVYSEPYPDNTAPYCCTRCPPPDIKDSVMMFKNRRENNLRNNAVECCVREPEPEIEPEPEPDDLCCACDDVESDVNLRRLDAENTRGLRHDRQISERPSRLWACPADADDGPYRNDEIYERPQIARRRPSFERQPSPNNRFDGQVYDTPSRNCLCPEDNDWPRRGGERSNIARQADYRNDGRIYERSTRNQPWQDDSRRRNSVERRQAAYRTDGRVYVTPTGRAQNDPRSTKSIRFSDNARIYKNYN